MESWVINLAPESRYEHIYFENGMLGLWKLRLLLLLLCLARGGRAEKNPNNKSQTFTTSFPSLVLWVMADELEKVKKNTHFLMTLVTRESSKMLKWLESPSHDSRFELSPRYKRYNNLSLEDGKENVELLFNDLLYCARNSAIVHYGGGWYCDWVPTKYPTRPHKAPQGP